MSLAALFIGIVVGSVWFRADPSFGSVPATEEFIATTTGSATSAYGNTITNDVKIKTGPGAFGSVVITGANTGIFNIYNATTSDVTKRTGNRATTTILLASFPASVAAGTYTFDARIDQGLWLELEAGIMPTTTITYR